MAKDNVFNIWYKFKGCISMDVPPVHLSRLICDLPLRPFTPWYQYLYSPHCSLYISNGTNEENVLNNQELPDLTILS